MPFVKKTKILIVLIVSAILIIFVLFQTKTAQEKLNRPSNQPQESTIKETTLKASVKINYDTRENLYSDIEINEGQTALDITQKVASISAIGEGATAYVTSINGRAADKGKKEFWEMLINNQSSQVGAGSYKVRDNDKIDWRIGTYE